MAIVWKIEQLDYDPATDNMKNIHYQVEDDSLPGVKLGYGSVGVLQEAPIMQYSTATEASCIEAVKWRLGDEAVAEIEAKVAAEVIKRGRTTSTVAVGAGPWVVDDPDAA